MNVRAEKPQYLANYISHLCEQNRRQFDSPYLWQFDHPDLPLNPAGRFSSHRRLFLEIGFGHGEVLEALVQRHTETAFIGIERRPARVKKALKRLQRIKPGNTALIRANLDLIAESLFCDGSFDGILINHPDPWPKRRHERHRFFRPAMMDWLTRLLKPQGTVEVASDCAEYFFYILALFEQDNRYVSVYGPPLYTCEPSSQRIMSRFEKRVRQKGDPVWILKFRKT